VVALEILSELGYDYLYGPDIAPETEDAGRDDFGTVILPRRLRAAVDILNPGIPAGAREEAIKKVLRSESQDLVHNNRSFHNMLVNGVDVEYQGQDGETIYDKVWLFDFSEPAENEFLAVNQFTIIEEGTTGLACMPDGDRKCVVVWHTQGSGKSLSMVFYTGKLALELDNPTIVVLTDRKDLDGQLFDNFARCSEILRQQPVQAETRLTLESFFQSLREGLYLRQFRNSHPKMKKTSFLYSPKGEILL